MAWVVVVFALVLGGLFEVWRRHRLAERRPLTFEQRESWRDELFARAFAEVEALTHYVAAHWEWRRR